MTKQTKATSISQKTKAIVWERDKHCCIVCGSQCAFPEAHVFVSRAHGGMGVKENIVTLCRECHRKLDNKAEKEHNFVKETVYNYMFEKYPNLEIGDLVYKKY